MRLPAIVTLCLGLLCMPGAGAAPDTLHVVRGEEDYPPFELRLQGQVTGLHGDTVAAVAQRLGLRLVWDSLPWKRALHLVEHGRADAVTYIARTPERERWAWFEADNVLSTAELRFIALKERAPSLDFRGQLQPFLAGRTVVAPRGFQFGLPELDRHKKLQASGMADAVRMLRAGHADVAALNWTDFQGAFAGKPELDAVQALDPPLHTIQSFIAFSRQQGHAELARRFGQAMREFKATPEYAALLHKYGLER